MIKRIPRPRISSELQIGKFFTTLDSPQDPRNHCIPILDSFEIDGDEGLYIVMPLLRDFDDPPFYSVKEVIEFVHQTLEVRVCYPFSHICLIKFEGYKIHARSSRCSQVCSESFNLHIQNIYFYPSGTFRRITL